jgi:hypothetical protein
MVDGFFAEQLFGVFQQRAGAVVMEVLHNLLGILKTKGRALLSAISGGVACRCYATGAYR